MHPVFPPGLKRRRHCGYRVGLFFLFQFSIATFSAAQSPFLFRHFDLADGLSNDGVSDIFQDSRGFIWIATHHGLNRFDGYEFKKYHYDSDDANSLSGNWVSSIAEDQDGSLWFGTLSNGLNRFDPRTETFTRFLSLADDKSPTKFIRKICCDREGRVWAASSAGLFRYLGKQTFTCLLEVMCHDIELDVQGTIWIATDTGLFFLEKGDSTAKQVPVCKGTISSVCVEPSGNAVWFFDLTGLKRLERSGESWRVVDCHITNDKLSDNNIFFPVYRDQRGRIWAGTRTRLWLLEKPGAPPRALDHAGSDPWSVGPGQVNAIYEDRAGNIWIGTESGGISLLNPNAGRFRDDRFPVELTGVGNINPIIRDSSGVWYTHANGLYFWQNGSASPGKLMLQAPVRSLLKSRKGEIYAGTAQRDRPGFYRISPGTSRPEFFGVETDASKSFFGGVVWSLEEDRAGRIWVGAWDDLQCFDPETKTFIHFTETWNRQCNSSAFLDLLTDINGDLWIATMSCGLFRLKHPHTLKKEADAQFDLFQNQPGDSTTISSNTVQTLLQTDRDTLWVGTGGGLNCFHIPSGKFRRFLNPDGLPDENILSLLNDRMGRLWMSTSGKGIVCLDRNNNRFVQFTMKDGLYSDVFLFNSVFQDANGTAFFGAEKGLQIFDPVHALSRNKHAPPLYFTAMTINGKPASWGNAGDALDSPLGFADGITLQPEHQTVTFQFATLYYGNTAHVRYWVILEGFHRDWVDNQNKREITFTSLWPRTYTMCIKAVNADEGWEAYSRPLSVRVLPPLYLRWPALLFYLLVAAGSVYAFYRFNLRRQLAAAEARRLRELDAFKNQFYANITHEFRTPLTAVLGAAAQIRQKPGVWLQEGLDMIERNGRDLLRLVNEMLDLSRLEAGVITVHSVQGDIVHYLRYLAESFHSLAAVKNIRLVFNSTLPGCQMDYDPEKLKKIFNNLLSNALKFTPSGGDIRVDVSTETAAKKNFLKFSVSDTGPGIPPGQLTRIFDRYFQGNAGQQYTGGAGIGLALSKELVKLLRGELWAESRPGEGAVFTVLLPVTNQAALHTGEPGVVETLGGFSGEMPAAGRGEDHPVDSDRLLLLLVEDNADVAHYLTELLKGQYRLEFARDGQEGIDKALERIPDLIVSDVMMPRKDGFELCRVLKNDVATSHIPVILLTARADMDSRLEGLKDGADEYLVKPFDERELLARIHNLLALRQRLRERYTQPELNPAPENIAFQREDAFFEKLHAVLEQHFSNPDFGIPELCLRVTMSRASLYRKLTALTGKNIESYLRRFRLQKAHAMLQNTDLPVQAVAWNCGFNDAAYFTKAFQAEFGMAPSKVRG